MDEDPRIAVIEHRIVMVDVDAVQTHYSSYFRWMDACYHALLAQLGHPLASILADGFGTPVVDARCSYIARAGLDEIVTVRTGVTNTGNSSFVIDYDMRNHDEPIARASTTHVWIEMKPQQRTLPLPEWLRAARVDGL